MYSGFRSEWIRTSHMRSIFLTFPAFGRGFKRGGKWRYLALFVPVLTESHQKMDEISVEYK